MQTIHLHVGRVGTGETAAPGLRLTSSVHLEDLPVALRPFAQGNLTCEFAVDDRLVARLAHFQDRPEEIADPELESLFPNPERVEQRPGFCWPDDIGAWLWKHAIPPGLQRVLEREIQCDSLRVVLHAYVPVASILPWELLRPRVVNAEHTPFLSGHWHLLRHQPLDADVAGRPNDRKGDDLQRRVLLLVGSQRQKLLVNNALYSVVELAVAISAAGFQCDIAWARPQLQNLDQVKDVKWHDLTQEGVLDVVKNGDYDIVHFIGHSGASAGGKPGLEGADQLLFEIGDTGQHFPIAIAEFAKALQDSPAQLVVLHACNSREAMAQSLLRRGAATMVVGMGARVAPAVCETFGAEFYRVLGQPDGTCVAAVHAGRQAIRAKQTSAHLAWLPLVFTHDAATTLGIAGPDSTLIDTYCGRLLERHRAFQGIFQGDRLHSNALDRVAISMSVQRLAAQAGGSAGAVLPVLQRLSGQQMAFDELLQLYPAWVLGGDPGIGKSTMQRLHMRRLARSRQRRKRELPVYLPLAAWIGALRRSEEMASARSEPELAKWVGRYLEIEYGVPGLAKAIEEKGKAGHLVLLLDGYDELSSTKHPRFPDDEADLEWFLKKPLVAFLDARGWGGCKRVITTRRYSSSERLPSDRFYDADVCALDEDGAVQLLTNILTVRNKTQERAEALARPWRQRFGATGAGSRLWQEVGRVPLLVSLLALQIEGGDPGLASTKLEFFERAFRALLLGEHRAGGETSSRSASARGAALDKAEAISEILRFLAWRFTVDRRRAASLQDLLTYLDPNAPEDRRAPPQVQKTLAGGEDWMGSQECLEHIGKVSLILGPQTTNEQSVWLFAHKSFQEALCARYLHARFIKLALEQKRSEADGVADLIEAFDGWVFSGRTKTPGTDSKREWLVVEGRFEAHRKTLAEVWDRQDASQVLRWHEIWMEACRATWLDAGQRDRDLNAAANSRDQARMREVALPMVAKERALHESQEAFIEALAMLAGELQDPAPLLKAMLDRGWQIGYRMARSIPWIPPTVLDGLLEKLPETLQWAEVVFSLPHTTRPAEQREMADQLASLARQAGKRQPGRVFLFDEVLRSLVESGGDQDQELVTKATEARKAILQMFDVPDASALERLLTEVPGREGEVDPETGQRGVRLWRSIPAGRFQMGTPGGGPRGDEGPVEREVKEEFWMMAVPVAVGLYLLFQPECEMFRSGKWHKASGLDRDLPAVNVNWFAAQMFVRWLNHHGRTTVQEELSRRGVSFAEGESIEFRLPTEEQREYATRAGSTTTYFFGDDANRLGDWGWFGEPNGAPQPVASKRARDVWGIAGANEWGLFDVHGNVWEWCQDIYQAKLPGGPDRLVFASGAPRVTRGGCYGSGAVNCRSADRGGVDPDGDGGVRGFRLVCVRVRPQLG